MNTSGDTRNPIERLAEDFIDRKRRGENPALSEYTDRYPELAEEIRDLFPALLMMEDLGATSGGSTGSLAADLGPIGSRLTQLGDYRILREIGRGGMGVVYEAEQESLGRRVALKVLSAGSLLDPKQVRRFEREAKAAAKLHHTNIVPVFGVGRQDGHHYFVMQFIAGLGLDVVLDDLRRLRGAKFAAVPASAANDAGGLSAAGVARSLIDGRFNGEAPAEDASATEPFADVALAASPASANGRLVDGSSVVLPGSSELSGSSEPDRKYYRSIARIGIQVAEALEYANHQGILHRDIKPSNLLLDNHGNVWVADFGLAKTTEADDLTHTGDILGTIRYMAPERFAGQCDARSDVYSLGLTVYELVALRPAFEASDRHGLIERVLHEEPERLEKMARGVPRDLETIISKAMAREPATRYATAGALAEDLRRFVEDRPIRARRISAAERLMRWCRRNKGLAASIGVATLALFAAVILSILYADRQSRHAAELSRANTRMTQLASDLERRGQLLESSLSESNRRLAIVNFERGRVAFEKGRMSSGMLWTVEALRMAGEAGNEDWKRASLANLSAWRRHQTELKEIFPHAGDITSVAYHPDGKTILTASNDKTVRVWDVGSGQALGPALVHPDQVIAAAFSPDGRTIVTGTASEDHAARFWDVATGRLIGAPLVLSGSALSVAFSPDGKTIVIGGSDKATRLRDVATRQPVGQAMAHTNTLTDVAFSPDGRTIVTVAYDKTARLWDAATGEPVGPVMAHPDSVASVAFSPDGRTILTGCYDHSAQLWDAHTGRPIGQPIAHPDGVRCVAFSPDGRTFVTGCFDGSVHLWDAAIRRPIGQPLEHPAAVWSVAFSPDGRSILTGCQDGLARLWECDLNRPIGRPLEEYAPATVAFSSDGERVVIPCSDMKIRMWDLASGRVLGHPVAQESGNYALALSPNGRTMLAVGPIKTTRLWDTATGLPLGLPVSHPDKVIALAFTLDGRTFLTGGWDNTVRLWDVATSRPVGVPIVHPDKVYAAALSPDGRTIATGGLDRTARLWESATGRPIGSPMSHLDWIAELAFSPDGRTIVTASQDKSVRIWDAASGRPLGPPMVHAAGVHAVAFSPDGHTILTRSWDQTARLWDTSTSQPLGPPMPNSPGRGQVAFGSAGRVLLTSDMRAVWRWDAPAPLPDDLPRLKAWVEATTGMELDERGSIRVLDHDAWLERRRRLETLGGPPSPDPSLRGDPFLFSPEPAARGNAWKQLGQWDRAEAAFTEAVRARSFNREVREALASLQVERGQVDRAAATMAEAVRLRPDSLQFHRRLGICLINSGDQIGWRRASAELLNRFGSTGSSGTANDAAWACTLGPGATSDPGVPVRIAEFAVRDCAESLKGLFLNTLGAALYRAGRFDEAIQRLQEGIERRGGASLPEDWLFLAMAHHRLGHQPEARRWLDKLRTYQPSDSPAQFWENLVTRVLKSEAEALILYDPVFPGDPFAR